MSPERRAHPREAIVAKAKHCLQPPMPMSSI
jgi:hypothetical protein